MATNIVPVLASTEQVVMQLIRQSNDATCGIATVAMIAGVSFLGAQKVMGWDAEELDLTSVPMMLKAIRSYGVKCDTRLKRSRHNGIEGLLSDAVINFDQPKGELFCNSHWAVWDVKRRKLLDPDAETDRKGMPFRYIAIYRNSRPPKSSPSIDDTPSSPGQRCSPARPHPPR